MPRSSAFTQRAASWSGTNSGPTMAQTSPCVISEFIRDGTVRDGHRTGRPFPQSTRCVACCFHECPMKCHAFAGGSRRIRPLYAQGSALISHARSMPAAST